MTKSSLFVLLTAAVLAQGQAKQRPLPAGEAKAIVETACTTCHALSLITGAGHTPVDWKLLVERMVSAGADVPKNQMAMVTDYLAKSFPEGNVPKAVIIPGPVKVSFKEWLLPTVGSRPHDPLATRDGYIWYTGQYANVLGRIDPKTGKIQEFRPPTPRSGPHGLVEDKDGHIWFTANSKGYIGELDPKTEKFSEYKLPADARDPHTPLFDQKGILWFTVQNSQKVGRLNPATGEVKVVDSPTKPSNPYGMVVDTKGTPYYCEFSAPKIAAINPTTMAIKEWTLPNPGRPSAPHRHHHGRPDLLCRLRPRLSGPSRSQDRRGEGMAVAQRARFAALRNHRGPRRHLVQRIEREAEYAGALRSQDRKIPDLGDPRRRRRGAQHDDHPRRQQHRDGGKRPQHRRPGDDHQVVGQTRR